MLPIAAVFVIALLVGWVVAEFKARPPIRLAVGLTLFLCTAYAGVLGGRLQAALASAWLPKEHMLTKASMERAQELLARGDTGTVLRAVGAYNRTVAISSNELGFYQASFEMWTHLRDRE